MRITYAREKICEIHEFFILANFYTGTFCLLANQQCILESQNFPPECKTGVIREKFLLLTLNHV